jgi:hypothetical protein
VAFRVRISIVAIVVEQNLSWHVGRRSTADKLEALGARRLAELLAELSTADPVVRKAAKLVLAAGQSPAKLLTEIDKRIRTIARSKTFIDWDRCKPLVQELENRRPDRR